jgi:UDP-N-acetylbacillosamine N-acetyltransferase
MNQPDENYKRGSRMTSMHEQQPLVIWGASGHAMVVVDILRLQGIYAIVGFIDDVNPNRRGTEFCGATILGGKEQLGPLFERGVRSIVLGFGDCRKRLELTGFLEAQGFSLPVVIHPKAVVAGDVVLGPGTVIAAGAVVNPGVRIGKSVIINTASSVDHECVIGDAAHICPGAHLAGQVIVDRAAQIGIGASVIERIHISAGAIIGAGAVVVRNIPDHVVAYGVPASIRRAIEY